MTQDEANAALERIGRIVESGAEPAPLAFGRMEDGWDQARAGLEEELREAAEALRAFVRTEDKRVGTVVTDWSDFRGILRGGCEWGICWQRR